MLPANANWITQSDKADQAPVYFADVDGISGTHYATGKISTTSGTHKQILGIPRISPGALDLLEGSWTVSRVVLPFLDVGGEASALFGSGAPGAPVTSWKNRNVTLYGGYRELGQVDYVKLFTGRVTGLKLAPGNAAYELELADPSYLIDGQLCTGATPEKPATILGNVVNVFVSLLRGTFSGTGDFPLLSWSSDTASSSAPTGLGIADADLDLAGMIAERDIWRPYDTVQIEIRDPQAAREYLQREFFRAFQARIAILGNGQLGFKFNKPATAGLASIPAVDLTTIATLESWEQLLSEHLNKFTVRGNHDADADTYQDLYAISTAEDTADRTATGETVEYVVESKWIRSFGSLGKTLSRELASTLRLLWLQAPASVVVSVNFRQRRLEPGDIVGVTHPDVPNQRTGVRGVSGRYMTVVRTEPDLELGRIKLELLDAGVKRFGVISPSTKTGDYSTATTAEREQFAFVCNASNQMGDGSPGYQAV